MKTTIQLISLVLSVFCGGYIFYELISNSLGFLTLFIFPAFIISSILAIFISTNFKFKYVHKKLSNLTIWLLLLSGVLSVIFAYDKIRNLSPILFSVEYYWEEGIYLDFRENGTFKARNENLVEGSISYGKYKMKDSLIILSDEVKLGWSKMNDTLIIKNDGIAFILESPWRKINGATMKYKRK